MDRSELKKATARYAGAKRNYGDNDPRVIELRQDFERTRFLVKFEDIVSDIPSLSDHDVMKIVELLTENRPSLDVVVRVVA